MDNEVPLPPPRRIRHRSPSRLSPAGSVASSFRRSRRLSRFDDRSSQPSSDPALFSSDDIPASGLENYHAPVAGAGRKRRYRGTWWGEQVADPKRKRADFKEKRNVDSGVWMGSDESIAESSLPSEDASNWGEDLLKTVLDPRAPSKVSNAPSLFKASDTVSTTVQPRPVISLGPVESEEHKYAKAVINDCLEKGDDSVDLGGINLRHIPPGLLRPLQHLTKLPSLHEAPVSENAYFSLQPFLRIYLSNNSLISLYTSEIFDLKDLKVLSLRNNKLTRIPEAIRKLTALQVLNVSMNRLDELPWDLLWLLQQGELKHFTARPNPFPSIDESGPVEWHCEFDKSDDENEAEDEDELDVPQTTPIPKFRDYEGVPPDEAWTPIHVATGPVTRLDMEGRVLEDNASFHAPSTSLPASRAPSLREVALRAISKLPGIDQLTDSELLEFPALVIPLISLARQTRQEGAQRCSICQREFIVSRAMWTEWWDCTPHENGYRQKDLAL
ncbi:Leucine Rich Repeat domain protein [Penicillium brasilianum]|uniref:Leucine Rich Repeat domain protein n=1 Tax=Penicillium brasilianum TaxID=104259 RepID=A0A1S9RC61_PENBI|nr:Leucine Rich Repeat domain protein [Penicillium brasilianum]